MLEAMRGMPGGIASFYSPDDAHFTDKKIAFYLELALWREQTASTQNSTIARASAHSRTCPSPCKCTERALSLHTHICPCSQKRLLDLCRYTR